VRGRPLAGLVALVALATGCSHPEEVAALEARKQELLATTVPKAEFWAEVERKGHAIEPEKALQREIESARARLAAADSGIASLRAGLSEARDVNGQAEEVRAKVEAEAQRVEGLTAAQEAALAGFAARRTAKPAA
jgi:chromosome segregation ATPase